MQIPVHLKLNSSDTHTTFVHSQGDSDSISNSSSSSDEWILLDVQGTLEMDGMTDGLDESDDEGSDQPADETVSETTKKRQQRRQLRRQRHLGEIVGLLDIENVSFLYIFRYIPNSNASLT